MTVIVENPTKMDDAVVQKLEEAFSLDCTVEEACFLANISKQTYYNWIKSFPEQKERFDALRQKPIIKARTTVIASLDDPDMALKYLERKKKDEFSTKQEIGIYQNDKIESQINDAQRAIERASEIANGLVPGEQPAITALPEPDTNSSDDSTPGA